MVFCAYCWCRVHNGRKSYDFSELPLLPSEQILCVGSSRKQPVLKWENNMAWPGKLTLTDKALYFEVLLLDDVNLLQLLLAIGIATC